jgi:protein gp37
MQLTKIKWPWEPLYTWNPIIGCPRGCSFDGKPYCYAKKISDRFKMVADFTKPEFKPGRLCEPSKLKRPAHIFVGSMSDIAFWTGVCMDSVLGVCARNPDHHFIFLSKSPYVYKKHSFPANCTLGLTITGTEGYIIKALSLFWELDRKNKTFISFEPLLGFAPSILGDYADLVVVGAMTGPGAAKPKKEWIDSIRLYVPEEKLFWKPSMKPYLRG